MPLSTASEGGTAPGNNPFTWPAFSGSSRVVDAWQLIDSIRQVRGEEVVWVAILDDGFWLDGSGVPLVSPFQAASDFGAGVMQWNLRSEGSPAGGPSSTSSAWHGNSVASVAAAAVNNALGAAGSSGNTAHPVFFRTDISIEQLMRCAQLCAAWGLDVLNMSIGTWGQSEFWFPTSQWNRAFQFAADNGVVMIAAAGNSSLDLPDDENIRPATRTPGVLTVGALDTNDTARSSSNYGSSVDLWAPGTSVPVAPNGNSLNGTTFSGTSAAAPVVAGVAAMMRYANPSLTAEQVRNLLVSTAQPGAGRVTRKLDAYAAVFAAIQGGLPDWDEPNNSHGAARALLPVAPGGALGPWSGGFTARSSSSDSDYWHFTVPQLSTVRVAVDWYERIASLYLAVETDDPEARGVEEMVRTGDAHSGRQVLEGLLPPGKYYVRVAGSGLTAYRLLVTIQAARVEADMFEPNDSFEQAAPLVFERSDPRWGIHRLREWGPGTFDATLHRTWAPWFPSPLMRINKDYFQLEVPESSVFRRPTVSVFDTDLPVTVTLYDAARNVLRSWENVRKMSVQPPPDSTCYLVVTGTGPTRYRISTGLKVGKDALPGPLQEELQILPKWWYVAEPEQLADPVAHYAVEINTDPGDGDLLAFRAPQAPVQLQLLDRAGQVLREGRSGEDELSLDTRGLEPGTYTLRVAVAVGAKGVTLQPLPPPR
jgi:hypothetical protein